MSQEIRSVPFELVEVIADDLMEVLNTAGIPPSMEVCLALVMVAGKVGTCTYSCPDRVLHGRTNGIQLMSILITTLANEITANKEIVALEFAVPEVKKEVEELVNQFQLMLYNIKKMGGSLDKDEKVH